MADNASTAQAPQAEQTPREVQSPPTQLLPAESTDNRTAEERYEAAKEQLSPGTRERFQAQIEELLKAIEEAQAAAKKARENADEATDPEEKKAYLEEAVKQEKIAAAELQIVKRMQSGIWQGGAGGVGIGLEIGAGVGALVGSLVGGVTAIPTTLLGGLGGVAAGAIHGPWYKLTGGEEAVKPDEKPDEKAKDVDEEKTLTGEETNGVEKAEVREEQAEPAASETA